MNGASTLRAIERRAERAVVQELRLMAQEVRTMRAHLTREDRAHADALLLKLSYLESSQQADTVAPPQPQNSLVSAEPASPSLALEPLAQHLPRHSP